MIHDCETCKDLKLVVRPRGDYAVAVRCVCAPVGACCDDGFVVELDASGYSVARRCAICADVCARRALFDAAHVPRRFHAATLLGFEQSSVNRHAPARAYRFAHEFQPGDPGLLFYGEPGRGKTHLMVGILRYLLLHRGISARYVEFMHLLSDLRATFSGGNAALVMGPLVDVPVLVLDELGKGRSARRTGNVRAAPEVSDWVGAVLDEIISKRYNAGRTTLFATNYYPGRSTGDAPSLEERIGQRMYSRLMEMCEAVHIAGDDYREKKAERRRAL